MGLEWLCSSAKCIKHVCGAETCSAPGEAAFTARFGPVEEKASQPAGTLSTPISAEIWASDKPSKASTTETITSPSGSLSNKHYRKAWADKTGTRLSINTGMCLLAFSLCNRGQPFIQGHSLMWISMFGGAPCATAHLCNKRAEKKWRRQQADEAAETSGHFPMNIGLFSQVWKHKDRQHATAPQYSCIASSFPFTKRQHDEKRLIRDKNDLIRVSRYNGCQIELQRLTPASRLITVLQYRYSTNDVQAGADARLSLDEWSLQQVQTHM